jgi:formylmethanofuran dehydrogenase subunit C
MSNPNNEIKDYTIPVEWSMYSTVTVKAKSLDEAIATVNENIEKLPLKDGEYIDGSYQINSSMILAVEGDTNKITKIGKTVLNPDGSIL